MNDCAYEVSWNYFIMLRLDDRFEDSREIERDENAVISGLQVISSIALMIANCKVIALRDGLFYGETLDDISSCLEALVVTLQDISPAGIVRLIDGKQGTGLMARLQMLSTLTGDELDDEDEAWMPSCFQRVFKAVKAQLKGGRATDARARFAKSKRLEHPVKLLIIREYLPFY
jgi:hypothetical protein